MMCAVGRGFSVFSKVVGEIFSQKSDKGTDFRVIVLAHFPNPANLFSKNYRIFARSLLVLLVCKHMIGCSLLVTTQSHISHISVILQFEDYEYTQIERSQKYRPYVLLLSVRVHNTQQLLSTFI